MTTERRKDKPRDLRLTDGTVIRNVEWAFLTDYTDYSGKPFSVWVPIIPWAIISRGQYSVIWENVILWNDISDELEEVGGDTVLDKDSQGKDITLGQVLNVASKGEWNYSGIIGGAVKESALDEFKKGGISPAFLAQPRVNDWLENTLQQMFAQGRNPTAQDIASITRVIPDLKNMERGGQVPGFLTAFEERRQGEMLPPSLRPQEAWGGKTQEQMLEQNYLPYVSKIVTADEVRAGYKLTPGDTVIAKDLAEAAELKANYWLPSSEFDFELADIATAREKATLEAGLLTHPDVVQTGRITAGYQAGAYPGTSRPEAKGWGTGLEPPEPIKPKTKKEVWETEWDELVKQSKIPRPSRITRL